MHELPAICLNCGYIFPSTLKGEETGSFIIVGADVHITTQQTCPRCKGPGSFDIPRLPVSESLAEVLDKTEMAKDLQDLAQAVSEALKTQASRDQAAELIESKARKYTGLARLMPHGRNEVIGYLGLLLAFAQIVEGVHFVVPDVHPTAIVSGLFHANY